jgi:hypothetical protein
VFFSGSTLGTDSRAKTGASICVPKIALQTAYRKVGIRQGSALSAYWHRVYDDANPLLIAHIRAHAD